MTNLEGLLRDAGENSERISQFNQRNPDLARQTVRDIVDTDKENLRTPENMDHNFREAQRIQDEIYEKIQKVNNGEGEVSYRLQRFDSNNRIIAGTTNEVRNLVLRQIGLPEVADKNYDSLVKEVTQFHAPEATLIYPTSFKDFKLDNGRNLGLNLMIKLRLSNVPGQYEHIDISLASFEEDPPSADENLDWFRSQRDNLRNEMAKLNHTD